jgi:hypothetical protein
MMRLLFAISFAALTFASASASAECVITINRTACPGKEAETFKPYGGKNPTEEKKKAASAEACAKEAEKTSKIIRKGTLAAKSAKATFAGAPVEGGKEWADKSDCK